MNYAGISIGDMYFNAIVSSVHEFSCTLAQHTMESGVTITDHVILEPRKFTVTVDISNAYGDVWPIRAFQTIEQAWRQRTPFTVITHHGIYDNMVIESGSLTENDIEPGRLSGSLALQQVMFTVINVNDGQSRVDLNALPGSYAGVGAIPQTDSGVRLEDPWLEYNINIPGTLEQAALGNLENEIPIDALPGPADLLPPVNLSPDLSPDALAALQTQSIPQPSKFPISFKDGNVTFSSPVGNETFNRFRTYTTYGLAGANVLLDLLDVDGNPIRRGVNMVPGADNVLRGYTDDVRINVLDITPHLPIADRIGKPSVQIAIGNSMTQWPQILRYD